MSKQHAKTTERTTYLSNDPPSQRAIRELKIRDPLPTGGNWFSTERQEFRVTRDAELAGYNIEDRRGGAWWVPSTNVVYVVYETVPVSAAAE